MTKQSSNHWRSRHPTLWLLSCLLGRDAGELQTNKMKMGSGQLGLGEGLERNWDRPTDQPSRGLSTLPQEVLSTASNFLIVCESTLCVPLSPTLHCGTSLIVPRHIGKVERGGGGKERALSWYRRIHGLQVENIPLNNRVSYEEREN